MAVETLYRSTRDLETIFVEKKLADQHDAMLELGEALTAALIQNVPGLDEKMGEEVGIFMAKIARPLLQLSRIIRLHCLRLVEKLRVDRVRYGLKDCPYRFIPCAGSSTKIRTLHLLLPLLSIRGQSVEQRF